MAFDRLIRAIDEKKNPTVAGLDPKLDYVPEFIKKDSREKYGDTLEAAADALLTFNKGLIDSLCDVVAAVKPQCAYYEMYGWQGVKALYDTIAYAKEKGLFVITDGKRNDIGTTMEAYAAAHIGKTEAFGKTFESFSADALTVNGYLGSDGINPLLNICKEEDKGIFVLVKTSNPSSGELQDRLLGDKTVYETMGEMCENWGKDSITDTRVSVRSSEQLIRNSFQVFAKKCRTHFSLYRVTVHRAEPPKILQVRLMRTDAEP